MADLFHLHYIFVALCFFQEMFAQSAGAAEYTDCTSAEE